MKVFNMRLNSLIKNNKSLLSFSGIVSIVSAASWLDFIAVLSLVAYTKDGSAFTVALTSIAMLVPQTLLSPFYKKIIERFSFNGLMQLGLLSRALLTLALCFTQDFYLLLGVLAFRSMFSGLYFPQLSKYCGSLDKSLKQKYSSILSLTSNISKLCAPVLGGLLATLFSEVFIFYVVTSLLFLASVLSIYAFKDHGFVSNLFNQKKQSISQKLPFSLSVEVGHAFIYYLLVFCCSNLLPFIFNQEGLSKLMFSITIAGSASGNIISGLFNLSKSDIKRDAFILFSLVVFIVFIGIGLLISLGKPIVYFLPILFLISGYFSASIQINMSTNAFVLGSDISTIYGSYLQGVQNSAMLIGPLIGAAILEYWQAYQLFLACGSFGIIYFLIIYLVNSIFVSRKRIISI